VDRKITMDLTNFVSGCGLDKSGSEESPAERSPVHGNVLRGFLKDREDLHQLSDYQLLKKDHVPWTVISSESKNEPCLQKMNLLLNIDYLLC
jgi:hypothetical protein